MSVYRQLKIEHLHLQLGAHVCLSAPWSYHPLIPDNEMIISHHGKSSPFKGQQSRSGTKDSNFSKDPTIVQFVFRFFPSLSHGGYGTGGARQGAMNKIPLPHFVLIPRNFLPFVLRKSST